MIIKKKSISLQWKRSVCFFSPSSIHSLDWLHGESGGHQVVGVVPATAHHEQALNLPHHKDQAALQTQEEQAITPQV